MKLSTQLFFFAAAVLLLSGCMTLTANKVLVVTPEPQDRKIVVMSNAVARCQDYFFFYRCTLNLEIHQEK